MDFFFLTLEEVVDLHEIQIQLFGGSDGLRDPGGLNAAVHAPQATFGGDYLLGDVFEIAAAYAHGIAERQPFIDGNKRTGLHAALTFLALNNIRVPHSIRLQEAMIDIANHRLDRAGLAALFRELAQ